MTTLFESALGSVTHSTKLEQLTLVIASTRGTSSESVSEARLMASLLLSPRMSSFVRSIGEAPFDVEAGVVGGGSRETGLRLRDTMPVRAIRGGRAGVGSGAGRSCLPCSTDS